MLSSEENKKEIISILILFLLPLIFLNFSLLSGTHILGSDNTDMRTEFFYTRHFGFRTLAEGSFPLWNPYIFSGMPFIATLHPAVLYPLNIIYTILPIVYAVNWSILLHLFLSGLFTYKLLRYLGSGRVGSVISGIIYTFSAPQIMHIYAGHLNVLTAMIWTPLMFLFTDRLIKGEGMRQGVYLSLTIALQLLAGQPQYLFYSMTALTIYACFRFVWLRIDQGAWQFIWRRAVSMAGFISLGLALTAAQLMPTMELTEYSTRDDLTFDWVSMFSFPPENLITFLVPDFYGNILNIPYWGKNYLWEMTAYIGIMPLFLVCIALLYSGKRREVYLFSSLAVISTILALGKFTPLLKFLYLYVPGFNLFRGNSKFIFLNALCLAVLSGLGANALLNELGSLTKKQTTRYRTTIAALISVIFLSILFIYLSCDEGWFREEINKVLSSGDLFVNPDPLQQNGFETSAAALFGRRALWAFLLTGTAGGILLLYSRGIFKRKMIGYLIPAVLIIDLFSFGMRYMITFDSSIAYMDKDIETFLKKDTEPFRVISPGIFSNTGIASGIQSLGGYDTLMLKRYSEFINESQGMSPDQVLLAIDIHTMNNLTDLMNGRYLVVPANAGFNNPDFQLIFRNNTHLIYRKLNALPRAFIVHAAKVVKDQASILSEFTAPNFNSAGYAIVEEDILKETYRPELRSDIPIFTSYAHNRITIKANAADQGLLVLGDTYYPGWKAYIDGKETAIYKTNYVMRGVVLSGGMHTVEFRYEPQSFRTGALISVITIFILSGIMVFAWRWKR